MLKVVISEHTQIAKSTKFRVTAMNTFKGRDSETPRLTLNMTKYQNASFQHSGKVIRNGTFFNTNSNKVPKFDNGKYRNFILIDEGMQEMGY